MTYKMPPFVCRLYQQMPDPKWVIALGACANFGDPFDTQATLQGVDVDVSGCPATPGGLIAGGLELQNRVIKYESVITRQGPEVARNLRLPEREGAGRRQVISLRQADPAAHTVLVKDPDGERTASTLRGGADRPRGGAGSNAR